MQSSYLGSPTSSATSIPHISVLRTALSKEVTNAAAAAAAINQPNFLRELSALNITNGNIIIPTSIQPPGLNHSSIEEPDNVRRTDIETPFTLIINEISEKNLDIMPSFDLPPIEGQNESIEAAIMIQIRRRKMKKHKLRKLRKRMKFEWAKVRQRREMRKEKEFQAGLLTQIREAEKFSAEEYVTMKLAKSKVPEKTPHKHSI